MDLTSILQFFSAALLAEIIGTVGGFGSATIFTPIAAIFTDVKTAIVLTTVFHMTGALVRMIYFIRHINWKILAWFLPSDIVLTLLGALIVTAIRDETIRLIFGGFLIAYGLITLLTNGKVIIKPSKIKLLLWGAISGLLAGLVGIGGAARAAALQMFNLNKNSYLGTGAAMGVVTDLTRLPVYASFGLIVFDDTNLNLIWGLVTVALLGALVGSKLAGRINESLFRKIVHVLLLAAGIYFVMF